RHTPLSLHDALPICSAEQSQQIWRDALDHRVERIRPVHLDRRASHELSCSIGRAQRAQSIAEARENLLNLLGRDATLWLPPGQRSEEPRLNSSHEWS